MTHLSRAIEAGARAIAASYGEDADDYASLLDICGPNNEPLLVWRKYAEQAEAVFAALAVEGFAVVPEKPSDAMIEAGDRVMYGRYGCSFETSPIYTAMIAASQEP